MYFPVIPMVTVFFAIPILSLKSHHVAQFFLSFLRSVRSSIFRSLSTSKSIPLSLSIAGIM